MKTFLLSLMYDLHRFKDITLLRVTFFKVFTSMERVFLQRLQNTGRRNLIWEITLLTWADQEKKPFPTRRQFFLFFGVGLAGKRIFLWKILSSQTPSFVTRFILSAVDGRHVLTATFFQHLCCSSQGKPMISELPKFILSSTFMCFLWLKSLCTTLISSIWLLNSQFLNANPFTSKLCFNSHMDLLCI